MNLWSLCQHRAAGGSPRSRLRQVVFGFIIGNIATYVLLTITRNGGHEKLAVGLSVDPDLDTSPAGDASIHGGDVRLARYLYKKVRILCWIMIRPGNNKKATASRDTWTRRCNKVIFIGSDPEFNNNIDVLKNVKESKSDLAAKTFASLTYIYHNHLNDFDWFLKADDDTFVMMENLRYYLSDEDPLRAVYVGEYFNPGGSRYLHYNSGGAGYVMSRGAVRRFGNEGSNRSACQDPAGAEDRALGYCLLHIGVKIGDSTDRFGRNRFHCDIAATYAVGGHNPWYRDFVGDRYKQGLDSMSDVPISFHRFLDYDIYFIDYLLYRFRTHGIVKSFPEVNS